MPRGLPWCHFQTQLPRQKYPGVDVQGLPWPSDISRLAAIDGSWANLAIAWIKWGCECLSGWWFGTFFIFHNIWDNPSHCLKFCRGVETTNQLSFWHQWRCCMILYDMVGIAICFWRAFQVSGCEQQYVQPLWLVHHCPLFDAWTWPAVQASLNTNPWS